MSYRVYYLEIGVHGEERGGTSLIFDTRYSTRMVNAVMKS